MNFLGHFYLSPPNREKLLLGNFLGDFVKGNIEQYHYPSEVSRGIALHRTIDSFTDHHTLILDAKRLFNKTYRRYAGIIIDMSLDHFLACDWETYHPQPLPEFSLSVYKALRENVMHMPETAKLASASMSRYNWLCSYGKLKNLGIAFKNIGQRLSHDNPMEDAAEELQRLYEPLENIFQQFILDIKDHIQANLLQDPSCF